MGKKSRKLRSPKYANKASALRQTVEALNTKGRNQNDQKTEKKVESAKPPTEKIGNALRFADESEVNQFKEKQIEVPVIAKEETEIEKPEMTTTKKKTASTTRKRRPFKTKTGT
jgi:hypothetical protein